MQLFGEIAGDFQLIGGNEYKLIACELAQSRRKRVDGAAEFQVAAEADGQVVKASFALADGHQVDEGLGGVTVAAVSGVDDRNPGKHGRPQGRALHGVTHGNDVSIIADDPGGVAHGLALAGAGELCPGKAKCPAAQPQHGRLKGQPGAGAGLIKQRGEDTSLRRVGIGGRIGLHSVGQVQYGQRFRQGEIGGIDEISHSHAPFSTKRSRSAPVETNWIS